MDCVSETLVKNLCGESANVMEFAERAFGDRRLHDVDVRYLPPDADVRGISNCESDVEVSEAVREWWEGP
jgi:hypothetical protein